MGKPKRIDWLVAVPGFVAFALGLVYGIGAISIYGQLKGAGLNGIEAMASVPLDQILSRGIGQAASTFAKVLVYAFVIAACAAMFYLPEAAERSEPASTTEPTQLSWGVRHVARFAHWLATTPLAAGGAISLVVAALLIETPRRDAEVLGITIGVTGMAIFAAVNITRRRGEAGVRRLVVVYATAYLTYLVGIVVATAFLNPAPLPHARLRMKHGGSVEGGLISESGSSWYVTQDNKSVLVVDSRLVTRSFITFPHRRPEQSALDWLLNRPPSNR